MVSSTILLPLYIIIFQYNNNQYNGKTISAVLASMSKSILQAFHHHHHGIVARILEKTTMKTLPSLYAFIRANLQFYQFNQLKIKEKENSLPTSFVIWKSMWKRNLHLLAIFCGGKSVENLFETTEYQFPPQRSVWESFSLVNETQGSTISQLLFL